MPDCAVRTYDTTSVSTVVHGIGSVNRIPSLLAELAGTRVVVVSTRSLLEAGGIGLRVAEILGDKLAGIAPPIRSRTPTEDVDAVEDFVRQRRGDSIVAVGGSSVSDGAKLAALRLGGGVPALVVIDGATTNAESGRTEKPIPLIVVPTTLSAGEYRGSAGMVRTGDGSKIMNEDGRLRPAAVVLDPELTIDTPAQLWAASGLKAIDHAAETIWGDRSHPFGDALAADALSRLARSLPRTLEHPEDLTSRLDCMLASWMSISTMSNTLIHLSHSLEHNMGSFWHLDHGVTSCIALPVVMDYLATESPAKVARVARALDASIAADMPDTEAAKAGAAWLEQFIAALGVPRRLRDVLADQSGIEQVARQATLALEYFGYVPPGGEATVLALITRMW
jgi:alcohol dehydrogenase class IV